jgi:hypothetical protein
VINERSFHHLFVFGRVAQKVHRVCDATVHVVSIAIKVVAKQSSVRCEQLFNTGALNLDGDVKQDTSAFLDSIPALLRTTKLSSGGDRVSYKLQKALYLPSDPAAGSGHFAPTAAAIGRRGGNRTTFLSPAAPCPDLVAGTISLISPQWPWMALRA